MKKTIDYDLRKQVEPKEQQGRHKSSVEMTAYWLRGITEQMPIPSLERLYNLESSSWDEPTMKKA